MSFVCDAVIATGTGAFHAGKTPAADSDKGGSGSDEGDWLHNPTGPTCLNKESTGTEVVMCGLYIGCILRVYSCNKSHQGLYGKANLNWS